jgi:hypothetical protein
MKSESLSIRGKFKDLENEYRVLQQKQRYRKLRSRKGLKKKTNGYIDIREIMQANEELHLEINGRNASVSEYLFLMVCKIYHIAFRYQIKYLEQDVTNLTASLEIEKEAHHKAIETMKVICSQQQIIFMYS